MTTVHRRAPHPNHSDSPPWPLWWYVNHKWTTAPSRPPLRPTKPQWPSWNTWGPLLFVTGDIPLYSLSWIFHGSVMVGKAICRPFLNRSLFRVAKGGERVGRALLEFREDVTIRACVTNIWKLWSRIQKKGREGLGEYTHISCFYRLSFNCL